MGGDSGSPGGQSVEPERRKGGFKSLICCPGIYNDVYASGGFLSFLLLV
jgi:hypothetical protein